MVNHIPGILGMYWFQILQKLDEFGWFVDRYVFYMAIFCHPRRTLRVKYQGWLVINFWINCYKSPAWMGNGRWRCEHTQWHRKSKGARNLKPIDKFGLVPRKWPRGLISEIIYTETDANCDRTTTNVNIQHANQIAALIDLEIEPRSFDECKQRRDWIYLEKSIAVLASLRKRRVFQYDQPYTPPNVQHVRN